MREGGVKAHIHYCAGVYDLRIEVSGFSVDKSEQCFGATGSWAEEADFLVEGRWWFGGGGGVKVGQGIMMALVSYDICLMLFLGPFFFVLCHQLADGMGRKGRKHVSSPAYSVRPQDQPTAGIF